MTRTFTDALLIVLREEGGYVNNPHDPGGITNLGITWRTWQRWTQRPADEQVMRTLQQSDVMPLYKMWYWDKISGDQLGTPIGLVVFDFAVTSRPSRAVRMLQGIVGASVDAQPGPATFRACQAYVTSIGAAKLIARFSDARRDYYRTLDTFDTFGHGWLARVNRVEQEALGWV